VVHTLSHAYLDVLFDVGEKLSLVGSEIPCGLAIELGMSLQLEDIENRRFLAARTILFEFFQGFTGLFIDCLTSEVPEV